MSVAIVPKSSSQAGYAPLVGELQTGEIALNTGDGALYAKLANGTVVRLNPAADSPVQKAQRAYGIPLLLG